MRRTRQKKQLHPHISPAGTGPSSVTNKVVMRRAGMERLQDNCYNKEKGNGWPRSQTAERKTSPNSYVLGARRRQTKDGEAKEDMAKHLQRRPRRDGRQLAWSPPDRQRP